MITTSRFPVSAPRQNTFAQALARVCRDEVLTEKWLLAPSLRVGHQWLDVVARLGQPVVNVRLKTLKHLSLELATPRWAADGVTTISDLTATVLVTRLLEQHRRAPPAGGGYLLSLTPSLGLAQSLLASLGDLRMAGVDDLSADACEVGTKGRELRTLLKDYRQELRKRRLADYADALRLATKAAPRVEALVLVPADFEPNALETALLDALPAERVRRLPVDETSDAAIELFQAVGEINEVRTALRRCIATGIPLDDVELLHTDADTYLPLIYEETERLSETPLVTFAEGVSARFSRPGRALAAWIAWQRDDFPQRALVRLLHDGLLNWPGDIPHSRLASLLRPLGIGFGRHRYRQVLDDQLASLDDAPATDEDGEPLADRPEAQRRRRDALQHLRGGIEALLAETPNERDSLSDWLAAAAKFVRDRSRSVTELDNYARVELLERIDGLAECVGVEPVEGLDVRAWLGGLPNDVRVRGEGPQPGKLHVANIRAGGHAGRGQTFIIGMDTSRWPVAGRQDPVLLDGERARISNRLPTAAQARENESRDFQRLLARLRGHVTLGFCARSVADDREMFPAAPVLAAYRAMSGKSDANETDLAKSLLPAASFAPTRAEDSLDESDWWRWLLCTAQPVSDASTVVAVRYPKLARGFAAAAARAGETFTAFDGCVPRAGTRDVVLSSSSLQTIGECPLRYFYRYRLGIEPPDELELDPSRWLKPSESGQLLHDVFYRFMRELVDAGRLPNADGDAARLEEILTECVTAWRRQVPPPSESVFRREQRLLRRAARTFLVEESEFCKTSRPMFLETAIGRPEPVTLPLPDGQAVNVRGYIDRIDSIGRDAFAVWDYKTFGTAKFEKKPPFNEGRIVQHVLYVALAEAWLREHESHRARVAKFGFFFPGERGRGQRLEWTPAELADGLPVIARLCELLARGAFLATTTTDDCRFCDYAACCGDLEIVTAASERKLRSTANSVLEPFRELRPPKRGHAES